MAIMLLLLSIPLGALAQYPAFTLAGMSGSSASTTLVRTYTSTQVATYYQRGGRNYIALVDIAGNVKETKLDDYYTVYDMRIVGDELYFCGLYQASPAAGLDMGDGVIGHLSLAALDAGSPVVDYYTDGSLTPLNRMAAYDMGGVVKVVALGLVYNADSPCSCPVMAAPYTCADHQLVEADFVDGVLTNVQYAQTAESPANVEELYDVVETDNYVAVIAVERPNHELTIHRCDKGNVLGTFEHYSVYPILCDTYEPGYIGCHVKADMVAVASFAWVSPAQHDYRTQVRVIDLPSQTMVSAQEYKMDEKTVPSEMVYFPDHSTLVLLQNQMLDPYAWRRAFVHLRPFAATPYLAEAHFESSMSVPFVSLDKAGNNYYVTTGGECWMLKDIATTPSVSSCYGYCGIEVRDIPTDRPMNRETYLTIATTYLAQSSSSHYSSTSYSIICQ